MSVEPSIYAENVSKREPEVIARELDRLQRKIRVYREALEAIARVFPGGLAAKAIAEGERI